MLSIMLLDIFMSNSLLKRIFILFSTPVVDLLVSLTGLAAPGTYNTLAWLCQTLAVRL